jgi:hypothetical protein
MITTSIINKNTQTNQKSFLNLPAIGGAAAFMIVYGGLDGIAEYECCK